MFILGVTFFSLRRIMFENMLDLGLWVSSKVSSSGRFQFANIGGIPVCEMVEEVPATKPNMCSQTKTIYIQRGALSVNRSTVVSYVPFMLATVLSERVSKLLIS